MAKMDRAIVLHRQRGLGAGILSERRMLTWITSTLRGRQPYQSPGDGRQRFPRNWRNFTPNIAALTPFAPRSSEGFLCFWAQVCSPAPSTAPCARRTELFLLQSLLWNCLSEEQLVAEVPPSCAAVGLCWQPAQCPGYQHPASPPRANGAGKKEIKINKPLRVKVYCVKLQDNERGKAKGKRRVKMLQTTICSEESVFVLSF